MWEAKPFPGVRTSASISRSWGGGGRGLDEASASASCFALRSACGGRLAGWASSESGGAMLLWHVRREGGGASASCAGLIGMVVEWDGILAMEAME